MEFTLNIQTFVFILVQAVMAAVVVSNNRNTVKYLEKQNAELKSWLSQLQDKVTELRVKVGV